MKKFTNSTFSKKLANEVRRIKNMKLLGFITMICIISAGIFMQSCGRYDDMHEIDQVDLVGNSVEYENYLMEVLAFVYEQDEMQNSRQIVGQVDGMNIYKTSTTKINRESLNRIFDNHEALTKKFPQYAKMDDSRKAALMNKVAMKSKKISKLIAGYEGLSTIRLKDGKEQKDILKELVTQLFSKFSSAIDMCIQYSQKFEIETGGYLFPNGTALFIYDTKATSTYMRLPVQKYPDGTVTFHYHPNGDPAMSPGDSAMIKTLKENGVKKMMIITDKGQTTYDL